MSGISSDDRVSAADRARSLISLSRSRYVSVVSLMEQFERVKEQYSSARYRVSAMASAPVASSLADLPADSANTLFSSALEAMDAVNILRGTTTALLKASNINCKESVLTCASQVSPFGFVPDTKRQRTCSSEQARENRAVDIMKRNLKTVCDTYETARQLIVSEMEDCDRLVRLALSGLEAADEDEVLFSARGELVTASRSSLLRTEGTYFYGLLNRGSWFTDAIGAHPIDDDSAVLKLVIASLVDRPAFYVHVRELDACTREYLVSRLDYYQLPRISFNQIRTHTSITAVHNDSLSQVSLKKTAENGNYRGAIWDPSIRRYSVTIDPSSSRAIMVGFAPSKVFDVSKDNCNSCGWYLFLSNGTLWAQGGVFKAYSSGCRVGDVIICIYDASSREISFERNGASLGVAYSNIIGEDIVPAVELGFIGDRITLSAC